MSIVIGFDGSPSAESAMRVGLREARLRGLDVCVDVEAREGSAGGVLTDAAEGADLLVVGSRGHGGVVGLLLGSVSQACARRPRCPLLIVPSGVTEPAAADGAVAAAG